ncbi:Copper ion-binding protein [Hirschfeldia incana]|nr:Copper ion-binding protein [Hirschfeldia incana]
MIRFTRTKPILDSLSQNLLQKCHASGTPKGKSKLKTIQALKRHKATTKRGGDEASKGKSTTITDHLINPPHPVRYLRPKDRDREAMREKLGLISKARQREIDIQKKLGPFTARAVSEEPIRIGYAGFDYVALGIFTEEELPKYKVTVEDGRRLAKEYSRVLMKEHREKRAAEIGLMKMRKDALEALPEKLKKAALERDTTTPFPVIRGAATVLPPVEGYLERIMNAANKKSSSKEKLR